MLELPALPELAPVSLTGLRLAPRLPLTQNVLGEPLSMSGSREQEILEHMMAMKQAFGISKAQNKLQSKRSKARDRAMQRAAER